MTTYDLDTIYEAVTSCLEDFYATGVISDDSGLKLEEAKEVLDAYITD